MKVLCVVVTGALAAVPSGNLIKIVSKRDAVRSARGAQERPDAAEWAE